MDIRKRLLGWAKGVWSLPLAYRIPAICLLVTCMLYAVLFLPSKDMAFSYASRESCAGYPTIFPGLLRETGDGQFTVKAGGIIRIAGIAIASTQACVTPLKPPVRGLYRSDVSLGGWLFKKTFVVRSGAAPTVDLTVLKKPVSTAQPLSLALSDTDAVFDYRLAVRGHEASCVPARKSIICDVPSLMLSQGTAYVLQLKRFFHGAEIMRKEMSVKTLAATRVTKAPLRGGATVYAKPRSFVFTFDKTLKRASARLYVMKGKKKEAIPGQSTVSSKTLSLKLTKDLPRSSTFALAIDGLEAADGSSLAKPYTLSFRTSGGPAVAGTNMGSTGLPLGSTFVVTFDQTLSAKQDLGNILTLSGGARYAGKVGNQLFISLAGVPRCGDFNIKLSGSLQSNYGIAGNSGWSFAGRMICHTLQTVGYSVNGRPITAYVFGSGPAVLYTGAIHGSELSTRSLLYYWVDELEANARSIPAGRSVVVVPEINPDGAAVGSRTNAHNVDLNRNFGTSDWRKDITDINNRPFPGGGGSSPMSEPEVRAIAGYAAQLRPSLILSYHSIGGVVAANQAGVSSSYASTYSRLSGYGNITGHSSETFDYSISGTADDYYAQKLGIASVLVELGSHTYSQFGLNQAAMWAMLR